MFKILLKKITEMIDQLRSQAYFLIDWVKTFESACSTDFKLPNSKSNCLTNLSDIRSSLINSFSPYNFNQIRLKCFLVFMVLNIGAMKHMICVLSSTTVKNTQWHM